MTKEQKHHINVLKFWRAIETYTLPDVPAPTEKSKHYFILHPDDTLPWLDETLVPSEDRKFKHTLYFYCFPKVRVTEALARLAPADSDEFLEPQSGETCLASLVLDQYGQPMEQTYVRSAFIYGLHILEKRGDPETLQELLKKAQADFLMRFQLKKEKDEPQPAGVQADQEDDGMEEQDGEWEEDGDEEEPVDSEEEPASGINPVTWDAIQKELDDLLTLAGTTLHVEFEVLCVTEEIPLQANPGAPYLNTFYLNALNYLINHPDDLGLPLEIFLSREVRSEDRLNLLSPPAMLASLDPALLAPGRWPANPNYGLYSAQLAALNLTLEPLRNHAGLRGINGPPGTGKTTLLREIIVDVVVTRARRLLNADIDKLFAARRQTIADQSGYYDIDETVFAGDGIVVTSNNNAAVENISKELPFIKSIDYETFSDASYFTDVAIQLDKNNPCWGLISAVLGSSKKKNSFTTDFWFGENGFAASLKPRNNSNKAISVQEHKQKYAQAAKELKHLLEQYDEFRETASEYYTLLLKMLGGKRISDRKVSRLEELAGLLEKEAGIPRAQLPGPNFTSLSMEDIHKMTPYSSPALNTLRSDIFLKSLEVIEYAIHLNARYFLSNIGAFVDMLSGKLMPQINEHIAQVLWNSFFFCVPVISTTLASLDPLFAKMNQGSIGWLLLDEAGQASPSSVCGALWRGRRCIIIGDTLQIPPVVTIPEGLGKFLQQDYDIWDPHWSPSHSSAQLLADRVTRFGTYVDANGGDIWTGIPLRAHRRCDDPMFTISNQIAYNGQMVKVTEAKPKAGKLPSSCWFDVKETRLDGKVVLDDIMTLWNIFTAIRPDIQGDIYAISPFRAVGKSAEEYFASKKYDPKKVDGAKITFGTVHTFQGKEADVVFLVLGMTRTNSGARAWASSAPNLLNVAVTRAKHHFYVIGDYDLWRHHPYFNLLADILPRKEFKTGTLF